MNTQGLDANDLAEVCADAGRDYVASGDRTGYARRLRQLGIGNSEILDNLRELDEKRADKFNQALATRDRNRNGKAA